MISSSSGVEVVAEHLGGLAEPAGFDEGRVAEVVGRDGERGGDVVADALEPGELLGGEDAAGVLLLEEPGVVAVADEVGVGDELVVLVEGDADEGDEVGEDALAGAAHLRAVELLVRLPELLGRPLVRGPADRLGELLDLAEGEPLGLAAGVEDLEGGDLVAVVLAEPLPGLDRAPRPVCGLGRVAGLEQLVGGGLVDRLLVQAAHLHDPPAQVGAGRERRGRLGEEGLGGGGDAVDVRLAAGGGLPGGGELPVGVEGGDEVARDLLEAPAAGELRELLALGRPELAVEPGQACGDRRADVGVGVVGGEGDALEERLERHGRLAVERHRVDEVALGDADRVDDHEPVLRPRVGGDGLEVRVADDAHAAPLHLLEVGAALDRAHEEDALERLHVGAGGDHVDGHGDARVVGVAEGGDQLVGLLAGRLVGDLGGEVVALAEHLAGDLDDLVGVRVVLGEDQRLRHLAAAGEDLGVEAVAERLQHGADLVAGDDRAVELAGGVGEVLVELLPARPAGLALAELGDDAGVDRRALLA